LRKAITCVEKPYLSLRIDYDYLTVGETGNILIRLQAVLRSLADLNRGRREQPRFVIESLETRGAIDLRVKLSILTVTAQIPQNLAFYQDAAGRAFQRFKVLAAAVAESRELEITVIRGKFDRQSPRLLEELSQRQKKKLNDFFRALLRPANSLVIGDQDSEIQIKRPDLPKLL
jgi:hypothetical protein